MKLWNDKAPFKEIEGFEPEITEYIAEGSKAAVIVCPGGAYEFRAPHEGPDIAKWLKKNGVSAFVLDYRTAQMQHLGYAPLADAMRAIRYVRYNSEKWGLDKNKIAIMGFSAGGHLAASLSVHFDKEIYTPSDETDREDTRPNASVLCYPVIDMFEYRHDGSRQNLIGENPLHKDKEFMALYKHVNENTPQTFIWHTSSDAAVPIENTLLYSSALSKAKVPFEVHIYPIGSHGLGLANDENHDCPYVSQWGESLLKWLELIGFKG
ncbi:MAG: alpha/beta hydrolase [Oscillospiraceae bacterium]|nr:alpha/beta hydrolase [Oscillospiraceae bacterium]